MASVRPAKPRLFLSAGWYALGLLLLAVLAFWPIYVAKLPWGTERHVNLHTVGVVAWMLLLIVQPMLIRRGRRPLHRTLGKLSYALVPYIAVTSVLLAHSRSAAMAPELFATDGHGVYLGLAAVLLFLACYVLAIRHRRDPFLHGRYMAATALPLIDPIVARLLFFYTPVPAGPLLYPAIGYGITDLILFALLWMDRREPRGRRAFLTLLPVFLVVHLGWFTLAQTKAWFSFADWFRALPLT